MKRTLFVASNRLGDAVLTTGVLHYLLKREPDVPITVVCGEIPKDIFEVIPGVERVISVTKRRYSMHWPEVAIELGFVYWHRIIDFRACLLGFLPARHRSIWKGGNDTIHKVIANANLIGHAAPLPAKIIPTCAQISESRRKWLGKTRDQEKILAIAPTANFFQKQWHFDNYIVLARSLTQKGGILEDAKIAVLGAPGEEIQALPVVNAFTGNQVINLIGKTTPMEAATILFQCNLFVGNDSGLMHTATAVNIPTVGLFGIGMPKVYGPWGDRSLCLTSTPAGVPITRVDKEGEVIDSLPVETVLQQTEAFYKRLSINQSKA